MRYTHVCFSRARLHVHGCNTGGCEPDGRMTELSRTFLQGFLARRGDHNGDDTPETQRDGHGGAGSSDGGVSDEEYERVQLEMCTFLAGVGFTARNPTPPDEGIALSEEARREGLNGLARDMRDFNWGDEDAARDRYAMLVNVTQRHTRCGVTACDKENAASATRTPAKKRFRLRLTLWSTHRLAASRIGRSSCCLRDSHRLQKERMGRELSLIHI